MTRLFQAIAGIFSFETLFVLYLFAGQYKKDETLTYYFNPPDLTPVLLAATVVAGLYIFIVNKFEINRQSLGIMSIYLVFCCYAGLSLSWSVSSEYGMTKVLYLGCQNFWNLIAAAIIIVPNSQRLSRLMFGIFIMSLIYIVISLAYLQHGGNEPISVTGGTTYDGVSFVIGSGIPVLVCYMMDYSKTGFTRSISFILCGIYFIVLLFIGHRGFLIVTVLSLVFLVIYSKYNALSSNFKVPFNNIYILILILTLIGSIIIIQLSGIEARTISRMEGLSSPTKDNSSLVRMAYYKDAFNIWMDHPIFGAGIGSFPVMTGAGDTRGYPHNLVLELLVELGLVGLLIYALFLFYGVKMLFKILFIESPQSFFVFMVFMTSFMDAFISSDITDHRFMMLALGLMTFPQVASQKAGISQDYGSCYRNLNQQIKSY
jgi:O-antigen ligase